ncbi:interleukin-31 receptor subunit alpha-like isoform X1 [Arapaima gigas]
MGHKSSSAVWLARLLLGCISAADVLSSRGTVTLTSDGKRNVDTPPCFELDDCHSSPHGVRDLDCFREPRSIKYQCVWNSGERSSNKTSSTLIVEQRQSCNKYTNISGTSHDIFVYRNYNMTAYVVETSTDGRNCTKAVFSGFPQHLVRCSPTQTVGFKRHSRRLEVLPSWKESDVTQYVVQYREHRSSSWKKSVEILKGDKWTAGNLTASASYEVQIQCVRNTGCLQCPWSQIFLVPMELTAEPVIEKLEAVPLGKGRRKVVIEWKLDPTEAADGYRVTVTKASGEHSQVLTTTVPRTRLHLSGSAFNISIEAFNGAGNSSPVLTSVPPMGGSDLADTLKVTLGGDTNFTVSWNRSATKSYWCYSVEWWQRGERPSSHSFYQRKDNSAKIPLQAPLQPYRRYVFLLHVRPDKDTCNLKHINESEMTYGRTEAYVAEGTPLSPPLNITCWRATRNSLEISWTSIPEEDLRGFLLGYNLYYSEADRENHSSTVRLGPSENTYTLSALRERTVHSVSLSAFTAAGEGVRSSPMYLNTNGSGNWKLTGATAGVAGGIIFLVIVAYLCNPLFHRAKALFWPSIPNPGNSNAIQKIDGVLDQEALEPITAGTTVQMKESDTSSLLIIEDHAASEPNGSSHLLVQRVADPPPAALPTEVEKEASSRDQASAPLLTHARDSRTTSPAPCVSDYTTMELFQQATALPAADQQPPPPLLAGVRAGQPDAGAQTKAGKDYIRQSLCSTVVLYLDTTGEGKVSILS